MRTVRPLADDEVDRFGVEVPQGMELTNTNRSRAYPEAIHSGNIAFDSSHRFAFSFQGIMFLFGEIPKWL